MPDAQNGWPVVPNTDAGRRQLADLVLPGGTMPHTVRVLSGDVHTVFRWLVREYHRRVEPIKPAGCWGWNVRKIGNGPDWSNHAAACAVDLNAPDNPDGVPASQVMTAAQIAACHALERESNDVLRWGGDYRSDPDAMHWEIVGSPAQVTALAKKIRNEEDDMEVTSFSTAARAQLQQEATDGSLGYKGGGLPTWTGSPAAPNFLNAFTKLFGMVQAMQSQISALVADNAQMSEALALLVKDPADGTPAEAEALPLIRAIRYADSPPPPE